MPASAHGLHLLRGRTDRLEVTFSGELGSCPVGLHVEGRLIDTFGNARVRLIDSVGAERGAVTVPFHEVPLGGIHHRYTWEKSVLVAAQTGLDLFGRSTAVQVRNFGHTHPIVSPWRVALDYSRPRMRGSEQLKTLGVSIVIHGSILAAALVFAGRKVLVSSEDEVLVEMEILPPESDVVEDVKPEPQPIEPEIPAIPRPPDPPKEVAVTVVEKVRPFQLNASKEEGEREAPDDVKAVAAPTMPLQFDMNQVVGGGSGLDYSSTTSGTIALPPPGPAGGELGDDYVAGVRNVKVARDWQITRRATPLNDREFEPDYPPLAKRQGLEAVVRLELEIDASGQLADARIIDGPKGHGFRESALAYVRKLRFEPAQSDADAVASRIEWTVYFYAHN